MTVIINRNGRWAGVDYTGNQPVTNSAVEQAMVNGGFAVWAPGSGPLNDGGVMRKSIDPALGPVASAADMAALAGSGVGICVNSSRLIRSEYQASVLSATITEDGTQTVGSSLLQANNSIFRYSNALMSAITGLGAQVGTAYAGRNRNDPTLAATTGGTQWAVEFDYWGQMLEPYLYGAANCTYWIWANNQPITAAPTAWATPTNNFQFRHVDFGSAALRRIRIEGSAVYGSGAVSAFNGVRSGSTVFACAPGESRPDVLAWIGDSYADGRKATALNTGFLRTLGRLAGMEAWQFPSLGGQGLIYTSLTPAGRHIDRIPTDYAPIPNVRATVLQASVNDINGSWDGTVGPMAVQTLAAAMAAQPNCKLWAVTSPLAVLSLSTYQTMSNQIKAALAAAYPNVPYIDMLTVPWITGTGRVGATNGSGLTDLAADNDALHPAQLGHDLLALAMWARLRAAWRI